MKTRRALFQAALVALIAVPQLPGTSQGLTQNQLKGLVERTVDDVPGVRQRGGKLTIEVWIVLDHEEAHGLLLR